MTGEGFSLILLQVKNFSVPQHKNINPVYSDNIRSYHLGTDCHSNLGYRPSRANTFAQEDNKSCFVFSLNDTIINGHHSSKIDNQCVPARDSIRSIVYTIWNFRQTEFAKIHDVRKIAPHLKMEYVKCHTDSLFRHHKIPDVVFRIDDNMKVQYYNSNGYVI